MTGKSISELIGSRAGTTIQLVVLGALLAVGIAIVLLLLGVLLSRLTERPGWLARLRSILRLILVSGGVSIPVIAFATLTLVYLARSGSQFNIGHVTWWPVFFMALLPAWLLVQTGHGELSNRSGDPGVSNGRLVVNLGVKLLVRLLKLVGAIIALAVLVEMTFAIPGLGRQLMDSVFRRDLPVVFGVAWNFAIIVVLVKLVAELIEIAYRWAFATPAPQVQPESRNSPRTGIPTGWLVVCLVLVTLSLITAAVAPLLAPYEFNQINLADRLAPPSAKHILGTDHLGRDLLTRLLHGLRTTLFASLLSVVVMVVAAAAWGVLAAWVKKADNWLGDTLEDLIMLPRDALCAFPWLVLLLILMGLTGPGFLQVALIGSLVLYPRALGMMQEGYSSAPPRRGHLMGAVWSIPVMFLFSVAGAVLFTSALGYMGMGVPPPFPELGSILSGSGLQYALTAPWVIQWPTLVLTLLSLTWVMAGDALLERLGFLSKAVWARAME
jgi:peptide/nickel transport system permease protein